MSKVPMCALAVGLCVSACGGGSPQKTTDAAATATQAPPAAGNGSAPSGPIDVCGRVTSADAAAIVGPLAPAAPPKTDHAGFGIYTCMYIGRALSGEGAQTIFARLTVSAGRGTDASDLLQNDATKRHATVDLRGVGDSAKRSEDGTFVWASRGGTFCTAEINHLPPGLAGDSAASQLGALCGKILAN